MTILDTLLGQDSATAPADRLDPGMHKVLSTLADMRPQPIETLTPAAARRQPTIADAAMRLLRESGDDKTYADGVATKALSIPSPAGDIAARLYGPELEDDGEDAQALPVVVYWHGGGFVLADLNTYDATPRAIARQAGCVVVSCDYRQAPEHRLPAPLEDALAAYRWVRENAASFGGDPDKVAVMGESAGGNIACNVAIMARDQGLPAPARMVLVYPVAGDDMDSPSYEENAHAAPLNKAMMAWFVQHYLDDPAQAADPRVNLVAADLTGLPDATLVMAQIDPLRCDGERLADALKAAGVDVHAHTYAGVTHEFFGLAPLVKDAAKAQALVVHDLKKSFGAGGLFG